MAKKTEEEVLAQKALAQKLAEDAARMDKAWELRRQRLLAKRGEEKHYVLYQRVSDNTKGIMTFRTKDKAKTDPLGLAGILRAIKSVSIVYRGKGELSGQGYFVRNVKTDEEYPINDFLDMHGRPDLKHGKLAAARVLPYELHRKHPVYKKDGSGITLKDEAWFGTDTAEEMAMQIRKRLVKPGSVNIETNKEFFVRDRASGTDESIADFLKYYKYLFTENM
jgi:hypothetical protein